MLPVKEWSTILNRLEETLSQAVVRTWFHKSHLLKEEDNRTFELIFPNIYALERVQTHYLHNLKEAIAQCFGLQEIALKTSVKKLAQKPLGPLLQEEGPKIVKINQGADSSKPQPTLKTLASGLSPYYTFSEFVVGTNNHLAYTVAVSIAQNPGKGYNPFFVYAPTGLGKTHLIQAIGNDIVNRFPQRKVVYSTGESFTNELLESILLRTQRKFREKFRNTDVLLIDDIQFIAGKEVTQEEFFNAFNELYLSQKQIILTSDRPAREIALLEEKLRSRFAGGMTADMQPPDATVRAAILRAKRDRGGFNVNDEVVDFIAGEVKTNIREMEGVFLQIVSVAKTKGVAADLELATAVLSQNKLLSQDQKPSAKKIVQEVCTLFNLSHKELAGPRRKKDLVVPRQICMYLLRTLAKLPLITIGEILGGRDHSTVIHGIGKVEKEKEDNPELLQRINFLTLKVCG